MGKDLDTVLAAVHKRWGLHVLRRGHAIDHIPHIPTGFRVLDTALGIGGIPRGFITELVGVPTSGCGTLALKIVAHAQETGDVGVYVDPDHIFDADWAARCGVDLTRLLIAQPRSVPQALEMLLAFIGSGVGILVFNSSFSPPFTVHTERLLSPLAHSRSALLMVQPGAAQSPAALRMELRRERWFLRRGDVWGYRTRVAITKNKFAAPGKRVTLSIGFSGTVRGDGV
jgi:RecA/RadA recombinase